MVAAVLVALLAPAGCGSAGPPDGRYAGPVDEVPLEDLAQTREARFAEARPTWLQDTTLHYGEETFEVPPAHLFWRTAYGMVLVLEEGQQSRYALFDGEGIAALPGSPVSLSVSPDGRYAGWIDQAPVANGDVAEVVVADLRTGEEMLRDNRQMGQDDLDMLTELYAEVSPAFIGFDATHAYWDPPVGAPSMLRVDLRTGEVSPGGGPVGNGLEGPVTRLADGNGIESRADWGPVQEIPTRGGMTGFASLDGRWCVTDGRPGRLWVQECRGGADATPDYPPGQVRFLGWGEDDALVVLAWRGEPAYEAGQPDDSTGVIARCEPATGSCTRVARVERTGSVLPATGLSPLVG